MLARLMDGGEYLPGFVVSRQAIKRWISSVFKLKVKVDSRGLMPDKD